MIATRTGLLALAFVAGWNSLSFAQAPAPAGADTPTAPSTRRSEAATPAPVQRREAQRPSYDSSVSEYRSPSRRTDPYPDPDQEWGFRNPGGVGRRREYYPPGNRFQNEGNPVRVAQFGAGANLPDRAEQLESQRVGIQRNQVLQQHLDAYGSPYSFYRGYGFGYGWGFGAPFPY